MRATIFFPARNICNEHPSPHNVFKSSTQAVERALDILEDLNSLRISVTNAYDRASLINRRRAGNVNAIAHAHGARVTDNWFPLRAGGYLLSFRHQLCGNFVK